ncbi:MAG: uracil-DNA glycosylase family protein [Candidatus Paceibacterota bacterium]|jgi:uracil-DNA glycosylase family 4
MNFFEKYRKQCEKCNRNKKVIIPSNDLKNGIPGKNRIKILFINERPGPKAEIVSFENCDPSAKLFKHLFIKTFGINFRKYIFITNAIIWVPTGKRRNYAPLQKELAQKNNLSILKKQIKLANPELIVPLGNSALYSIKKTYPESKTLRKYKLKNNIGTPIKDCSINIFPVYHTSGLAQKTRNKKQQEQDWIKLRFARTVKLATN